VLISGSWPLVGSNMILPPLAVQRARVPDAEHGWVACNCGSLLLFALPRLAERPASVHRQGPARTLEQDGCSEAPASEAPAQASQGAGLVGSWATLQWRDGGLEAFTPQPLRAHPLAHSRACPVNNYPRADMPCARLRERPAHHGAGACMTRSNACAAAQARGRLRRRSWRWRPRSRERRR